MQLKWYEKYKSPFETNFFYNIAVEEKKTTQKFKTFNYEIHGDGHILWKTTSNELLKKISDNFDIDVNDVMYWESHSTKGLMPHVDPRSKNIEGNYNSGNLIIPLYGNTRTSIWGDYEHYDENNAVMFENFEQGKTPIATIEHSPGDIVALDISRCIHSVEILTEYRLIIVARLKNYEFK